MKSLEGKVAIITGSSRGIGRAVAEHLAGSGASVVVNYSKTPDRADEVVRGIVQKGGKAIAICADVSKVNDVEKLFVETIAALGKVDILVNCAAISISKPILEVTEVDFDKQFAVNVKGTYFTCQKAMKYMENGGKIVNFSTSIVGQVYSENGVYAATKGAVEQITRQTAREFARKQITINTVAPGPTVTEMYLEGKTDEQLETVRKANAFGRLGQPEDIADVVELLVSDKSHWVSGQTLRVNGAFI